MSCSQSTLLNLWNLVATAYKILTLSDTADLAVTLDGYHSDGTIPEIA